MARHSEAHHSVHPSGPKRSPHQGQQPWCRHDSAADYSRLRPTIRMRLTLLYGGMFLVAGIVLLLLIYFLTAQALRNSGTAFHLLGGIDLRMASDVCQELHQAQSVGEFNGALDACLDDQRDAALNSLLHRSTLVLMVLTVLAFALGYVLSGRVLSPLGRITRTARGVASSDLDKRIELGGPDDELKELADTFDDMLERLDRAFNAQQRFVANASHELRTPLAINRTVLEVQMSDPNAEPALVQLGKTLLATNERSEQLVEGLLLLARSENEVFERKSVDLAEKASLAVDQVRAKADAVGVELRGERQPVHTLGNGVLLERVALNLLQNAVQYNIPHGGWVEASTSADSGYVSLTVANTGPVIPAYEVDDLFEPFRRLRSARAGSGQGVGLGLSIVRSVARAHGGTVRAEPREGGGLNVHVKMPAQ
ncbi:sensor histidine kinase [Streptomyces sp. NPDC059649]|uniref:sensor histidine kinase n=1 Tax=Streptomyces sp. NPDC059649 TaxID=3346895 RepID=UPI00368CDF90